MKKFLKSFVVAVLLVCTFSLFGCDIIQTKSAYDIAVDNGFVGTETEWLASLKGEDGRDGVNGKDGTLTAESLFEKAVALGIYSNDEAGYQQFLKDYFVTYGDTLVQQVSAKCVNQVVSIYCPVSSGLQMGAGVIYEINTTDNYAYIITNYHVIALEESSYFSTTYTPATTIYCYLYGRETIGQDTDSNGSSYYVKGESGIEATYIGGSAEYDLAVLRVTGESFDIIKNSSAMAITFANSDNVQVGENAIAIGNPEGGGMSVTSGIVSQTSERVSVSIAGESRTLRCFRIDTAVNEGNSGGGLFDSQGNFLGITNAKVTSSKIDNIANAICSNNVKNVVENVIYNYNNKGEDETTVGVKKVTFGITYTASDKNNVYNETGSTNTTTNTALVASVTAGGLADKMKIEVGDKIVGMAVKHSGDAVFNTTYFDRTFEQLNDFVLTLREGDTIEFVVKKKQSDGTYLDTTTSSLSATLEASNFKISKDNAQTPTTSSSTTNSSDVE
jgi:serine protease Do